MVGKKGQLFLQWIHEGNQQDCLVLPNSIQHCTTDTRTNKKPKL